GPAIVQVKGAAGFQIDGTGNAQSGESRQGRLVDLGTGEKLGWKIAKVGSGSVDGGGAQKGFTVQRGADVAQAANLNRATFARGALNLNAGNPLERVCDSHVRQLADVFSGDGIHHRGGVALGVDRIQL